MEIQSYAEAGIRSHRNTAMLIKISAQRRSRKDGHFFLNAASSAFGAVVAMKQNLTLLTQEKNKKTDKEANTEVLS